MSLNHSKEGKKHFYISSEEESTNIHHCNSSSHQQSSEFGQENEQISPIKKSCSSSSKKRAYLELMETNLAAVKEEDASEGSKSNNGAPTFGQLSEGRSGSKNSSFEKGGILSSKLIFSNKKSREIKKERSFSPIKAPVFATPRHDRNQQANQIQLLQNNNNFGLEEKEAPVMVVNLVLLDNKESKIEIFEGNDITFSLMKFCMREGIEDVALVEILKRRIDRELKRILRKKNTKKVVEEPPSLQNQQPQRPPISRTPQKNQRNGTTPLSYSKSFYTNKTFQAKNSPMKKVDSQSKLRNIMLRKLSSHNNDNTVRNRNERLNLSRENIAQRSNSFARFTNNPPSYSANKENLSFIGNIDRDSTNFNNQTRNSKVGGVYRSSGLLKSFQKFLPDYNSKRAMTPRKAPIETPRKLQGNLNCSGIATRTPGKRILKSSNKKIVKKTKKKKATKLPNPSTLNSTRGRIKSPLQSARGKRAINTPKQIEIREFQPFETKEEKNEKSLEIDFNALKVVFEVIDTDMDNYIDYEDLLCLNLKNRQIGKLLQVYFIEDFGDEEKIDFNQFISFVMRNDLIKTIQDVRNNKLSNRTSRRRQE